MWRIMQIEEYVNNQQRWITASKIWIILHIIQKPNSINISGKYLTSLSPLVLSSKLWPISGYKKMFFFLDDTPQKVDRFNAHPAICMFCVFLHFLWSVLVRYSAISSLDSWERHLFQFITVRVASFPGKYTIDQPCCQYGMLLASFKYSKRQLVMKN